MLTYKEKVEYLQRWIIVHSFLYYELDSNVVEDKVFDKQAKKLVAYKEEMGEEWKNTQYYHAMSDFDGTTGFDLWEKLTEKEKRIIESIAYTIKGRGINNDKNNGHRRKSNN